MARTDHDRKLRRRPEVAKHRELIKMQTMVVAPIPLGKRKATPVDGDLSRNVSDTETRWVTYGFLMAAEWFRRSDVERPTREYLEALAAMYGLPMPVMVIE